MGNAQRINEARRYGSQKADDLADRYLIHFNEPDMGKGYLRSYKLDDNDRHTRIVAHAYGQFFYKSVKLEVLSDSAPRTLTLKPKRKLLNNGYILVDTSSEQTLATIERVRKGAWELKNQRAEVLAKTFHNLPKLDQFVESFDCMGSRESQYGLLLNENPIAFARSTSVYADPEAAAVAIKSGAKPKGLVQKIFGIPATSRDSAIALAFTEDAGAWPDDPLLMSLMMVHHECNVARSG